MTSSVASLRELRNDAIRDWAECGDCFYSKELLYDMGWEDVDPENKRMACARFGGPIATVRDERKMTRVGGVGSVRPVVRVFSAAGVELGALVWDKGRIIDWGWSSQLELVIVEESSKVLVYSMHAEKLREFSLGEEVEKEGLAQVSVYGDGLVVVTFSGTVWMVPDLREPRPVRLASPDPPLDARGSGGVPLAVLESRFSMSGGAEVLVAVGPLVWQLDDQSATDHTLPQPLEATTVITLLQLSPDGQLLAIYTRDGRLVVVAADFSRQVSEYSTNASVAPLQMAWVGTDALMLYWPTRLLVVGPYGDYVSWDLSSDERMVAITEVDGVRLISADRHELLRRVPEELVQVFRLGSTLPAAQLWDARDLYEANNARSDKVLRLLGGKLPEAVSACITAAGSELNVPRQKALLRSACYGRAFCQPNFPVMLMHNTCKQLRVLNALREAGVGVPLTMVQLELLTLPVVVARLIVYRMWLLAYRIAGGIRQAGALPSSSGSSEAAPPTLSSAPSPPSPPAPTASTSAQEQVLIQWACAKISAPSSMSLPDGELKDQLTLKLRSSPHIRFAPLAAHAQAVGRRKLALRLLEEESSCALQVPLLLSLSIGQGKPGGGGAAAGNSRARHEEDSTDADGGTTEDTLGRALRKAIESGDTDLVYLVLFHIYKHTPLLEFWTLASARMLARNLFVKFCRAKEPELLETILSTTGQTIPLALHHLERCLEAFAVTHERGAADDAALGKLVASLGDVATKFATSREHVFQSKAVAEMAALRREQGRLERETGQHLYVGLSLIDTLRQCVRFGHHKAAAALKKQFAVTDKRFYWLKARTLAEARDWEGLDTFAAERKSPVGWEPFLEVAKKFGAPREYQARLIARMENSAAKAEQYSLIDCPREAAEVAGKLGNGTLFAQIQNAVAANAQAAQAIAQAKDRWFPNLQRS